jgi:hypothetical protein
LRRAFCNNKCPGIVNSKLHDQAINRDIAKLYAPRVNVLWRRSGWRHVSALLNAFTAKSENGRHAPTNYH